MTWAYGKQGRPVDVICQHNSDGGIIPIKIRVRDEEGERQTYVIKSYKELRSEGAYTTVDGVYVTEEDLVFDCRIMVFGKVKPLRLYYCLHSSLWHMGC